MQINPKLDSVEHININAKGATWLGKFLSHRTLCELNMPEGRFLCVAAYWYHLTCKEDSRLNRVHDWETELLATQLTALPKKQQLPAAELQAKIKKALDQKIKWSEYWQEEFTESSLPFLHYHLDAEGNVVDESRKYRWLLNHLEARRTLLQQRRDNAA
ncbi:MAG: hypothetical protein IM526_02500 [Microcystis sp. M38BS1]|uniref:hypothetical protein n=1 Tax=Microcystis sp. M38BS1 TaxID=2771188 RepID=UPI0031FE0185|nr:hypothetical protein [Microcystis sp. M38BS1]MCA6582529.1 hypothetical protein [Pseudanabaena sp. M34BS1SP1A06MG]